MMGTLTMTTVELLILDCDGVLIDSELIACRAEAAALTSAGYKIDAQTVASRFCGQTSDLMYAEIEADWGRPPPPELHADVMERILAAYRTELSPIPGAAEFLDRVTVRKCVASSSAPSKLALGLVETGLYDRLYPHVFSAHLVERGKPYPDIFNYAADAMGAAKSSCLVVEDSVAGVQAAVAAGIRCIGFTGGAHCLPGHDATLRRAGAEVVAADLSQVLPFLPG